MNRPPVSQFVITEHLGEILRQVQETVIQVVCGKIKALERHPIPMRRLKYKLTLGCTLPYQQNRNHFLETEPAMLEE